MSEIDLYFGSSADRELPSYIRIVTITGILCLFASFCLSLSLNLAFEHPQNNDKLFKSSSQRDTVIILMIITAVIGLFLSSFVFYGHYLRNRYDPKSIVKGPMNIVSFPNIDKDIKVNDFREKDLKPRYYYSKKNKLRSDFL